MPDPERTTGRRTRGARPGAATGVAGLAPNPATADAAPAAEAQALRRIPLTADVLAPIDAAEEADFRQKRLLSVTQFHLAIRDTARQLDLVRQFLQQRPVPIRMFGTLHQPDGSLAPHVQLGTELAGTRYAALSDEHGAFVLQVSRGLTFGPSDRLALQFHGANATARLEIAPSAIADNGLIGGITLPTTLAPLPVSIIQALKDLLPDTVPADPAGAATPSANEPKVMLGEGAACATSYRMDCTVSRFRYGVFFRLVEPRTSIVSAARWHVFPGKKLGGFLPLWETGKSFSGQKASYIDRVPIEQPISVDGFRDRIVGLDGGTSVGTQETVPMAGTLGLGYVVQMAQAWTPKGFALGNLVYSLPLAPGEQQRVAIFERRDVAVVRESELLSVEEQQAFTQLNDTSANAVATSAFRESAAGGSHFDTESSSDSWSVGFIFASGGAGSSSSSGNSSSWLTGSRDSVQRAAEDTHAAVQRQASARRDALRTSMRLASASESASVTTKVITNHNHTRALTLQYWEVQRLFEVGTQVEGVSLVCLVPLEVVRFLPAGQPLALNSPSLVASRPKVLDRYSLVLKHADVLGRSLPREHQYGLTLLKQFAGDPTASVEQAGGAAEDVINFSLVGTFLPFEEIWVSAVTRRGTRVGPVRLTGTTPSIPTLANDKTSAFPTKAALLGHLRKLRNQSPGSTLSGSLAIPPSLARNDIIGFEVSRRFQPYDYNLVQQEVLYAWIFGLNATTPGHVISETVHLAPGELEKELGGPILSHFSARLITLVSDGSGGVNPVSSESYANGPLGGEMPPEPMPVAAVQLAPVLRYSQVLEIERMLHHVVRNTVSYSKAVWWSLTPEERAIMLEGFTIGVPPEGLAEADESQMVPLLNCVENRVLGFYGNSLMMPFIIPRSVADTMDITSGQVQDMLTRFHKTGFEPPTSLIALPTRGVLGEAVLGNCPSAEKIDITRFWNWADAPADTAPEIAASQVPTTQPSIAAGITAPNTLAGLQPLINNFNASGGAGAADTSLVQAMVKAAAEQKDFPVDLTGASLLAPLVKNTQDTAEKARADALKTTRDLNELTIATAGNIVGGMFANNPTAGSDALKALNGGADGGSGKSADASKSTGDKAKSGGEAGKSGGGSGGGTGGGNGGSGGGSGGSGGGAEPGGNGGGE